MRISEDFLKIIFEDKTWIDCVKSDKGTIFITVAAPHETDPLKKVINAAELTMEQFKKLISDIK